MTNWEQWEGTIANAYLHWLARLDSNGESTIKGSDVWFSRFAAQLFPPAGTNSNIDRFNSEDGILRVLLPLAPYVDINELPNATGLKAIVGVIDTDIPLGHRAFRDENGASRVLYHWQMDFGATNNGKSFGKGEIDRLLAKHSGGRLDGTLDATSFNSEIGSLRMEEPRGPRALLSRHSHGAHVLDLAAGANARAALMGLPDDPFPRDVGIVTIGIPPRWDFGEAGELLDLMMLLAVNQVSDVVSKLWTKAHGAPSKPSVGMVGFPTVINLAFGRQAGSKRNDGGWFPVVLAEIKKDVTSNRGTQPAPFEVIMPAGNDNLGRVAARYELDPNTEVQIPWQILPSDQTDNFVEVWAEGTGRRSATPRLEIELIAPGDRRSVPIEGPLGKYLDVLDDGNRFAARIYRLREPAKVDADARKRPGYLFALGPSEPRSEALGAVPSGAWTLYLRNAGSEKLLVEVSVQTDQSVLPLAGSSGRSYLDERTYEVFDEAGRLNDAVRWDDVAQEWVRDEGYAGVLRHGTINAAASHAVAETVGGYRQSDGMPASYSATGSGLESGHTPPNRSAPNCSLTTDTSAVLPGTLAAAAGDGCRVAMRGTSFASARATRIVAEAWRAATVTPLDTAAAILERAASQHEATDPFPHRPYSHNTTAHEAAYPKFGYGRTPPPETDGSGNPPRREK
ncbi:hypothetical protein [Jannaschia sp. CCS1]|uniref:hypothetical protein n=1 Tax=Jannaschia sp. (strain CCS1) TaxID=290400 RepID=UPI000053B66A|nr:hypothetical protein [Jannaschia sp. CCS1]ABD56447.1 hypothetical protein Jann_3530 [Jannaschia sp. CCS1]